MKYTGEYKQMFSHMAGEKVSILKYENKRSKTYYYCSRCGKKIHKTMYVVQSQETDIELFYLGEECIKHLN